MRCVSKGLVAAGVSAICALAFGGGLAAVLVLAPSTRGYDVTTGTVLGGTVGTERRSGGRRRRSRYYVYTVTWTVAFTPGATSAPGAPASYTATVKDPRHWNSMADAEATVRSTKTLPVYYDPRDPSKAAAQRRDVHSAVLPLAANTAFCLILASVVVLMRRSFCSMTL